MHANFVRTIKSSMCPFCICKPFVATLALGLQPRQKGCKGAGQEEAQESRQKGHKGASQEEAWKSHHILPRV